MGNICSWCVKDQDQSQLNSNHSVTTTDSDDILRPYVIILLKFDFY
jgi:hypothetical protein